MAIKKLIDINKHLFMCNGGSCKLLGAEETILRIRAGLKEIGMDQKVHTTKTMCNGRCKDGPIVISVPDGIWFRQIKPSDVPEFLGRYLLNNSPPVEKILFRYGER